MQQLVIMLYGLVEALAIVSAAATTQLTVTAPWGISWGPVVCN